MIGETSLLVACISKNGTNPAYEGARVGIRRIAHSLGHEVISGWPATPDDPDEQSELILKAIAQKPNGLLVAPAHPERTDAALAKAVAAGIPVVSFVSRSAAIEPACFVTSDNYLLARAIGEFLIAHIGGKGRVAVIEGNPNSETSAPRTRGFLDIIAEAPGIELAAIAIGDYQREPARQAMAEIAAAHPDLAGVMVANDFMALGAIEALKAAGMSVPVVSVNAMPQAIDALKSGDLLATAAFDAMKIASTAMLALERIFQGQKVPKTIVLPVDIVTADNCANWDCGYEERPLPNWREVCENQSQ